MNRTAPLPVNLAKGSGPLAGFRIIEFDAIGPIPLAATILADFGCDVVRIGRPARTRDAGAAPPVMGRGRRHITLDLKVGADRDRALALVARADALIEGSRPGVMERLGLGPDRCLAANSKLVYGRMTGWGQTGPLAHTAGHDINYIALTGVLHAIGTAESPVVPLNLVGDYGGGAMMLALGVCSGLLCAQATGTGQVVDAAMTDGSALLMSLFYTMLADGRWSEERGANLLDGGAPFYRTYPCRDGRHVAVGAIEPAFFGKLLQGLGIDQERLSQSDRATWPTMTKLFGERFAERTRDDWASVFAGTDACVTPVLSMIEAPNHPHNRARTTFGVISGVTQPMPAPRFSATPSVAVSTESTDATTILTEWAQTCSRLTPGNG